ncbi:MAG TPA: diphosphate--fructose-6-phosphate 1-phosphotransferase, partial [Chloroflexota bacterium]|nr:diphosphate--fructose-6-phosphate 1-phosphotransferase [Chloroflexota bacterium]
MTASNPALLVAQSGGCTAAINASLAGVVQQALAGAPIGPILGARFGVEGILQRRFLDLRAQEAGVWETIRRTPSAALGSGRRRLDAAEREQALDTLIELDVRYLLHIGGNDSADTALGLHEAARGRGYDLRVVAVPKTIDNDLPGTDHCPGYGSAARFLAQTTQDAGLDTEAMRDSDPLKIIEVMGRDAGWLAAATTLGKREERDAPHVVCVPELPLAIDAFIGAMEDAYRRFGHAVAVVAETVRDSEGRPLGRLNEVQSADAFGHPVIAGAAQALSTMVGRAL